MKPKYIVKFSITLLIFCILTINSILSFLVDQGVTPNENVTLGEVRVDYHIYFDDGIQTVDADEVYIGKYDGIDYYKTGVYEVNLNDKDSIYFIENLRIDFLVYSTVDTYLRVEIIAPTMLITSNIDNTIKSEYVVITNTPLKYANDWSYHQSQNHDYIYYKNKVIKPQVGNYLTVPFVDSYFEVPYEERNDYWLHLAISVDAVQADRGPEENWKLDFKPWEVGNVPW